MYFVDNILKQAWALFLHTVKWFQVLLYKSQFNTSHLFAHLDRTLSVITTPGQSEPGSNANKGVFHIPQDWNFTIRYLNVISGYSLGRGEVLLLCRDVVGVFYSPSRLGCANKVSSDDCAFYSTEDISN